MFDLFVIHAVDDREFVRGYLLPALNLPAQRVLLLDDLPLGAVLVSAIDRGISSSRFTVVVLSPAYLQDRWAVYGEQLAIHVSVEDVHVIPLRLADVRLPLRLDARIALDFTDSARWDAEAARLRRLLDTAAPVREQLHCPYPGMRPFTEHEASLFFGRDDELREIIRLLDHDDECEIYAIGPSGSGKSSLVQAGLTHALKPGESILRSSFLVRTMRPGLQPTARLQEVLEGDLALPEATIGGLLSRHPPATRALIIIDQLEELFTLSDASDRQRFITEMRNLHTNSPCHFLLVLRADFYGAFMDSHDLWASGTNPTRIDILPLRGPVLAQAIMGPAMRVGVHIERRLCDRLVADAATEPGALPHVQETMRLLWERRRHRLLGLAEYEELGGEAGRGIEVAIGQRIDQTLHKLVSPQRTIARRVLLRLIAFGEGRADTRRQQAVRALRSATDDESDFFNALQKLVENRLVTIHGSKQADDALVDLSHEALITASAALREWITQRRADEQLRRRLEAKAAEWMERGGGTASLLDWSQASDAEQWMNGTAAQDLGYGLELLAFVKASKLQVTRVHQQMRRRIMQMVMAFIFVIFVGIAAFHQRQEARRQVRGQHLFERGEARLERHQPMQALPYFVASRSDGLESAMLRDSFARAARDAPMATLFGHILQINNRKLGQDNKYMVIGDDTLYILNIYTNERISLKHDKRITTASLSPDGTRVITTSEDNKVRIWETEIGKAVTLPFSPDTPCVIVAAAFSSDGTHIVTTSGSKDSAIQPDPPDDPHLDSSGIGKEPRTSVPRRSRTCAITQVWDVARGLTAEPPLEHQDIVAAATFSPDANHVLTISRRGTPQLWDINTRKPIELPSAYGITGAVFSPDGKQMVTMSTHGKAWVWRVTGEKSSDGNPLMSTLIHPGPVKAATFSPDGILLATVSDDNVARIWDSQTGKIVWQLGHQGVVTAIAFSPNSTRVITATEGSARIWDVQRGEPLPLLFEHPGITAVAFSSDGTHVVTASEDTASIWNTETNEPLSTPLDHTTYPVTAAFSPDGTQIATVEDNIVKVWNLTLTRGEPLLLKHQAPIAVATFSPGGLLVTASGNVVNIWNLSIERQETLTLGRPITVMALSPSGKLAISASDDNTAYIWNVATRTPLKTPLEHGGTVTAAIFSPDSNHVVTASKDRMIRTWDTETGKLIPPLLVDHGIVTTVAFDDDGTRVVTASGNTAQIWNAHTGIPMIPPLEHGDVVTAAAFSPSGTWVVTASRDKTARVWDAVTGEALTTLQHDDVVTAAAFSSDGKHVMTLSHNGIVRNWDLSIVLGSLEDWKQFLSCTPFAPADGELSLNPHPAVVCRRR